MDASHRKMLQKIADSITVVTLPNGSKRVSCNFRLDDIKQTLDAVLSEPLRNCDVGDAKDQSNRWSDFCKGRLCKECPARQRANGGAVCYLTWAQMPYEESDIEYE